MTSPIRLRVAYRIGLSARVLHRQYSGGDDLSLLRYRSKLRASRSLGG